MLQNIYLTNGVIFSQRVLTKLIDKGLSREIAYDIIQSLSMISFNNNISFKGLLMKDETISKHISSSELEDLFKIEYFLKNVDNIYKRVGI